MPALKTIFFLLAFTLSATASTLSLASDQASDSASKALERFTTVTTPFFAKIEVSDQGKKPIVFDMRYDGVSKVALVGPPPKEHAGAMKMLTMNGHDMLGSLGLNEQAIKDKGTFIGKETHLNEPCEHWELESRIEHQGKTPSQFSPLV